MDKKINTLTPRRTPRKTKDSDSNNCNLNTESTLSSPSDKLCLTPVSSKQYSPCGTKENYKRNDNVDETDTFLDPKSRLERDHRVIWFRKNTYFSELTICTGLSLIHMAAVSGNHHLMQLCIDHEYDVNAQDACGCTPLLLSVQKKYYKVVEILIANGADMFKCNMSGMNVVKLIGNSDYENTSILCIITTALYRTVTIQNMSSEEMVYRLKEANWPLSYIMRLAEPSVFRMALINGINLNQQDSYGKTALHRAVAGKKSAWTRQLLTCGADPNIKDIEGCTPLHHPVLTRNCPAILRDLMVFGTKIYDLDIVGRFQCVYLLKHGQGQLVRQLGDLELYRKDAHGDTILHYVAHNPHKNVVEYVCDMSVNTEVRNKAGETALHIASQLGNVAFIESIIMRRADTTAKDGKGRTPLFYFLQNKALLPKATLRQITDLFLTFGAQDFELLQGLDTSDYEDLDKELLIVLDNINQSIEKS